MNDSARGVWGSRAVTLSGIAKRYGRRSILEGVDLSVAAGGVTGLVGPNGAGKTTVLNIVAGLCRPSSGEGDVLGQAIGARKRPSPFVGIMTERPGFVEHLSGRRNLVLLASLRGVATSRDIEGALARVCLDPADRRPVRSYSQGMRQRLALAQAIMEKPRLLLLDEPTNGLDPAGIAEIRGIIGAAATEGAAVLLSSHLLSEVEAICDSVVLIDGGRATPLRAEPRSRGADDLLVVVEVSSAEHVRLVEGIRGAAVHARPSPCTLVVRWGSSVPELVRRLVDAGIDVERVGVATETLEDLYLRGTQLVSS